MAEIAAPTADAPVIDAQAPATPAASTDADELARTKAALKAANKEAEAHRLKLQAYEKAEAEKAEAEKSETQKALDAKAKAEQEAATARAELQEERTKNAVIAAAGKADFGDGATKQKFIDPDAAYVFIKAKNPGIAADEILDALKALAKSKPWMLEGATTQQQSNPGPAKGQRPNSQTLSASAQDKINQKRSQYGTGI